MHRIFLYGTLKSTEPNFGVLVDPGNGKAVFVGKATTTRKYPLLIASRWNLPYLLDKPGTGHRIHGELYDIDDKMLQFLDEFECHPDYYFRRREEIEHEGGKNEVVWIYTLPKFREDFLNGKQLMNQYSSKGPHGREYVPGEVSSTIDDIYDEIQ